MRLDLFVKLKYQLNTKLLSVCIKYSVRGLLFDINDCLTRKLAICVTYKVNEVSVLSGISSL